MKKIVLIALLILLSLPFFKLAPFAFATPFSQAMIRYDRMKTTSPTSIQVIIVPQTVGTEAKIKIVFGAGVVVGSGVSVTSTNLYTGTSLPGTLTVTGAGGSLVVGGLTDLSVGTTYGFNISVGLSTPSSPGQILDTITSQTAGDAAIDSTVVASRFISDDQIVITGNVPPSFTFTLSGNTDAFTADLGSTAVVSTTGRTVSVTTNAAKGWIGWVKSANAALSSATTLESIGTTGVVDTTPSTCVNNSDCYVLDADKTTTGAGSGSLAIAAEYDGADASSGGTLSTSLTPFVTRTGKTAGDVITLIARASILSTKAAGSDYIDTLTVIGAGNF